MFTEEEIGLLTHCLGLYDEEVDLRTEERREVKELIEKLKGVKPHQGAGRVSSEEKDDFIGGALLAGIKNKLRECVETLKSKDATLEAICSMLEREPSPKELDIIEAVLSGAQIMDSANSHVVPSSHYWKIYKPVADKPVTEELRPQ